MKILQYIKEFYNKSIVNKIIYFVLMIAICFGIAFLYERFNSIYRYTHNNNLTDYLQDIVYSGLEQVEVNDKKQVVRVIPNQNTEVIQEETVNDENGEKTEETQTEVEETPVEETSPTYNQDPYLRATANDAIIVYVLKEPVYIGKLDIVVDSLDSGSISYEISSDTKYLPQDVIYSAEVFPGEIDVANVDARVLQIRLSLKNVLNRTFQIKLTSSEFVPYFNQVRFLLVSAGAFLTLIVVSYILGIFKLRYQNLFLYFAIPLCLIASYYIPPHYTWDEFSHLTRAVYLSQGITDVTEDTEAYFPYNYEYLDQTNFRSIEDYNKYLEFFENPDGSNLETEPRHIDTTASTYLFLPYLIPAAGIWFARTFGLSAYYYIVFSRLANAIIFILMSYFGIKLFRGNKLLITFIALTPIMFNMCCSSGTNAFIVGTFILTIGIITYYRKTKKEIPYWMYILLLFFLSLVTIARMTYGFSFFLLLLLPKDQFKSKWLGKLNVVILAVIAVGLMGFTYYYSSMISGFKIFIANSNIQPGMQLRLIKNHPFIFLQRVWVLTEKLFSLSLFMDPVNGSFLGTVSSIYFLIFGVALILAILGGNPNNLYINDWYSRILILLIFALCYGATVTSMYVTSTGYDSGEIYGMQTRYIIPFFFIVFPTIQGKNFYLQSNRKIYIGGIMIVTLILSLMFIGLIIGRFYM